MTYGTHVVQLNTLLWVKSQEDAESLSGVLFAQGIPPIFTLQAHRRRNAWGITLPIGVFDNDFRPASRTLEQHVEARERLYELARNEEPYRRRPFPPRFDVLESDGALYYHPEALRVYAKFIEQPAFLRAVYRFLEAANDRPSLIIPKRVATFVPIEKRVEVYGNTCRGPDWTPDEDAVLRRWFGRRTVGPNAGRHVKLTDDEWAKVLAELPMRNKTSVRNRLVELNRRIQALFFRNGFVSRDKLPEYMNQVLGERPRIPIRPIKRR